ncbi:MAG: hypothetical protein NC307_12145 [Roseburia sp.]|nr:hypothetical protein [Roseburia sp.]
MTKMMRKLKKMAIAITMTLVLIIGLIGCASTTPVTDGDMVENTEELVATDTETTVDTDTGTTTKTEGGEATETEIKDGAVAGSDKPAGTASPTAEPSATGKPESTAEPTAPPHVHEYAESITKQPTCAEAGVKTLTCSCGEVKTEAIPATGHDFVTQYKTVEHEALGHVEVTEQQVQVGTNFRIIGYECVYCGAMFDSAADVVEHCKATGDFVHATSSTNMVGYEEPVYETQTTQTWVIDSPAWTEQIPNGFVCSKCGATK